MNESQTKKEKSAQYKEREIIGGVYAIKNTVNDRLLVDAAVDLRGRLNRFEFSRKTGSCVYVKLQNDWNEQGGEQFVFEVLEELKKGATQTAEEFKADIDVLKEMWLEKLAGSNFY